MLIVEDEALVLFLLQDMLADFGCEVVASALRIDDALDMARSLEFDIAILDVNVAGQRIDPVADLLASRGVPFLFASGYGRSSLPAGHRDRVALNKPYLARDVEVALGACLAGPDRPGPT